MSEQVGTTESKSKKKFKFELKEDTPRDDESSSTQDGVEDCE